MFQTVISWNAYIIRLGKVEGEFLIEKRERAFLPNIRAVVLK